MKLSGMSDQYLFVTDYGNVRISARILRAMDATFPGWRDPPIKGRSKAIRHYNKHARNGGEELARVVRGIAYLAWAANQDFIEI